MISIKGRGFINWGSTLRGNMHFVLWQVHPNSKILSVRSYGHLQHAPGLPIPHRKAARLCDVRFRVVGSGV